METESGDCDQNQEIARRIDRPTPARTGIPAVVELIEHTDESLLFDTEPVIATVEIEEHIRGVSGFPTADGLVSLVGAVVMVSGEVSGTLRLLATTSFVLVLLNGPFISTIDPAAVIEDPATVLVTLGLLTAVASRIGVRSAEVREAEM